MNGAPRRQLADVQHARDVLALDPGGGARLAREPRDHLRDARRLLAQELQRHALLQLLVDGRDHDAHPPFAEDPPDPVLARDELPLGNRSRTRRHRPHPATEVRQRATP